MGVKISLGRFISTRRKQKFMTQEELANKMHVSKSAIAKWETDGGVPDRDNLYRLAEIIGVSVDSMHQIIAGNVCVNEEQSVKPNITQDVIQLLESYGYLVVRPEENEGNIVVEIKEALEKFSDSMYIEELNMTNKEAINISLFELIRIYSSETGKEISNDLSIVYVVVIAAFAVFALLTLLFSILRKSIPVIVFNILTFAVLRLIIWDFEDRGVISNSRYDWGIAQYIGYIGIAIVMVGAVALLVVKKKDRRKQKTLAQ